MRTGSEKSASALLGQRLYTIAGLCLLTIVAYSNSFSDGLVFDSSRLLREDPRVHDASAENLGLILRHTYWWPSYESGLYRPLGTISYLYNYAVLGNGENPPGYHWINLLLHLGNVLLAYALARRLFREFWPPVFIAGLWAVHPVLTESVTNISGRVDLMAGMAVLSGLLCYLKSTETRGVRQWSWLAALMAITFLGVFSKENAVIIIGLIILYEMVWWTERRNVRGLLLGCAVLAPLLLFLWYARRTVMSGIAGAPFSFLDNPLIGASFWTARLTALKVLAHDLGLLAWPVTLSADYSYNQIPLAHGSLGDWIAWTTLAVVIVGLILARRHRAVLFAAGFAVIAVAPTANLLFPIGSIMAERFLYLPSLGFVVCVVAAFYALPRQQRIALYVIAGLFLVRTWVRNADWHDDVSVARSIVRASPASYKGHAMLAAALYRSRGDLDTIISESEKSLAILQPLPPPKTDALPYQQAGQYYLTHGDELLARAADGAAIPARARQDYEKARQVLQRCRSIVDANTAHQNVEAHARGEAPVKPTAFADLFRLTSALDLRLGDVPRALDQAVYALSLAPTSGPAYMQLADVFLHSGRAQDAAVELMKGAIITKDPVLTEQLIRLYRGGLDPQRCAAVEAQGRLTLNPSCAIVRRHLCQASPGAEKIYTDAGRPDLAANTHAEVWTALGCGP